MTVARAFYLFAFLPFSSIGAPALPEIQVPIFEEEILIDGRADESVWLKSASLELMDNDSATIPIEPTTVLLFISNDALFLSWKIFDKDIQATLTERDSQFWDEEVVELFLSTEALDKYYELQWNPLNGVFDAIITNQLDSTGNSKGIIGVTEYTAIGMQSAVYVEGTVGNASDSDKFWSVEVKIPFQALKIQQPKRSEVWRANLFRFNRGNPVNLERQSWSPTMTSSFHQPAKFGSLIFTD